MTTKIQTCFVSHWLQQQHPGGAIIRTSVDFSPPEKRSSSSYYYYCYYYCYIKDNTMNTNNSCDNVLINITPWCR